MRGEGQGEQDYNVAELSDLATKTLPIRLFCTGSQAVLPSVFGWMKTIGFRVTDLGVRPGFILSWRFNIRQGI